MKLKMKKGIRFFQEDGNTYLLNAYTRDFVKIDHYGTIMFDLVREKEDFDDILSSLYQVYPEEDPKEVKKALTAFVEGMENHSIFEVTGIASEADISER